MVPLLLLLLLLAAAPAGSSLLDPPPGSGSAADSTPAPDNNTPLLGETVSNLLNPLVTTLVGDLMGLTIVITPILNPAAINPIAILKADWFFGVPFAKAPVGNLRFEKPQPAEPWHGSVLDVSSPFSNMPCYNQHNPPIGLWWTEDCLRLNIYRPSGASPTAGLPVLVFIHTGGWAVGGTLIEGPFGFTSFYVAQGIIVVQLQYRLSLLGFAADGTDELPGNLGLWDQRMALQWISDNIASFGGDPNRVTLWGQSAGSASTGFHSITPGSYNLFQQVVQMSGSPNAPWAVSNKSVVSTRQAAADLGCANATSLKQCLKGKSIGQLQAQMNAIPYAATDFNFVLYTPRVDDDFLNDTIADLIAQAPPKPTLTGFTTDESIILTIAFPDPAFDITTGWTIPDSQFDSYNAADLIAFINANVVPSDVEGSVNISALRASIVDFYVGRGANSSCDSKFYIQRYTLLLSDIQFIVPVLWESRLKAQHGWRQHLFHFDHVDANLTSRLPYPAVSHLAEYPYDIGVFLFGRYAFDDADTAVCHTLVQKLVNFVKTGDPNGSGDSPQWSPLSSGSSYTYSALNINVAPHMEAGDTDVAARIAFWDSLASQYDLRLVKGFPGKNY